MVCCGPSTYPLVALQNHLVICFDSSNAAQDLATGLWSFSRASGADLVSNIEVFILLPDIHKHSSHSNSNLSSNSDSNSDSNSHPDSNPDSDLQDLADAQGDTRREECCELLHNNSTVSLGGGVLKWLLASLLAQVEAHFASFGFADMDTKIQDANSIISTVCSRLTFNAYPASFADDLKKLVSRFVAPSDPVAWSALTGNREPGGFGLLDPKKLLLSHCSALIAKMASSRLTEEGQTFCTGFAKAVVDMKGSATVLLLRGQDQEPLPATYINKRLERDYWHHGSFWDRCLHTLAKLHVAIQPSPDWDSFTPEEILSLPWQPPALYGCNMVGLTDTMYRDYMAAGLWSWADILWYNNRRPGRGDHLSFSLLPICPILTQAMNVHWDGRSQINWPYWTAQDSPVRTQLSNATSIFRTRWEPYWNALPEGLKGKLCSIPDKFKPEEDQAHCTAAQSGHARPFRWELALFELPWRHLTIATPPLGISQL